MTNNIDKNMKANVGDLIAEIDLTKLDDCPYKEKIFCGGECPCDQYKFYQKKIELLMKGAEYIN